MTPTPPSTASSSGYSPEFRIIRKRNRVPLSCAPCRHRKLKCNRSNPCENCVKRGDASSCSYSQASTRKKNNHQQNSLATPDDMQNRIDRLEGLVLSLMTNDSQSGGPAAIRAAISGQSSSASTGPSNQIDPDIDEDGAVMGDESETEQVTKSFGVMKVDNNKSYYISEAHWASVLKDITEVRNFFSSHQRQLEEQAAKVQAASPQTDIPGHWDDPSQTQIVWIAMLFAIMRLAMLSYHREGDEPPEFKGKAMDMAGSFRHSVAQCLTMADYSKPHAWLIESLIFHLHGDFSQTREADVSVWVLTGVIARLAMRMGYHRDSKPFPNITPFQGEMRRRVWSFVSQADLLFSFQVGMPSMIRNSDSDTELPRNLYDDDFDEHCKALPPPRQLSEPTPISYLITKTRLAAIFGRVNEQASAILSTSYDKIMEIDAELRRARDLIPDHLQIRPMEDCQQDPVNLIMSRFSVNTLYYKAQIVLHRPFLVRARENSRFTYSRRICIDCALEMLRVQQILCTEMQNGRLQGRNLISSLSSNDFLLAATIVCLDLHQGYQLQAAGKMSGDTYTWGCERHDEMRLAILASKEVWDARRDYSMEAYKASSVLGVMLSKLQQSTAPEIENSVGAAIFEPQDEKQNAAMTLGLLSSGMSPMNTGPAPYTDNMFKMADSNMPGVVTTEMPGAPMSPFSSMFSQMPEMQANVDWEAWDTYIQNPTLDTSNQFWPMVDPSIQPTDPTGFTQAAMASPLGASRMPSMLTNGLLRVPNMFTPSTNNPDSGGSSVPGFTPMSQPDSTGRSHGSM
ncbi:hypothetical protein N7495_004682 [Penicillium taxi]|uniref:uncharacterized protein n=1 Tax=Penicillium taxi TaxID=168475 RepID=UPI002545128D|nr:uncharacterized protein N7495_004682 [Penicillium taxi]KAJ5899938.1 hypothetical protein N7495_004682 [Penicillium taxi]